MGQSTPEIYRHLLSRLGEVRRQEDQATLLRGALLWVLLAGSGVLCVLLIELAFHLEPLPRTLLVGALLLTAATLAVWWVGVPLLRLLGILPAESPENTAAKVGAGFPHIKDHLVNILQLFPGSGRTAFYSPELIDASFEDVRREIEPVDFTAVVDHAPSRRYGTWCGATLAAGALLFLLFPSAFFGSAHRLVHFNRSFAAPLPFTLIVEPGNREVVRGETVTVRVRVEGRPPQQVTLASKPEGQLAFEEVTMDANPEGRFVYAFRALKATTRYFARAGSIQSDAYTLRVVDRPIIRMLRLELAFPPYAGLTPRRLDDNVGDVTALKGTSVTFAVEASKDLDSAMLMFEDQSATPLTVRGNRATGSIRLMKDRTYHLALRDAGGLTNADPVEYTMRVLPDASPTAAILVPGANLDIAENVSLNMLFKIADDYGFTRLRLAHRLVHSRYEKPAGEYSFVSVPIPGGVRTEGTVAYLWNIAPLSLVPEDVIHYYIEVFDNDQVSGPKSGRSEIYTLRLPSINEVFAEMDRRQDVTLEGMQEALKEAQQAKKELDDLQQQLRKNQQKVEWQEQKKAEQLLQKYDEIRKKLGQANQNVEQMLDQMQKNRLMSRETMEKYQELQRMMEEMNSPELEEMMKRLQDAMRQLSPEALRQALQQFNFSEEMFRKSIERTLDLLKRIQIEQKVEEAIQRAEELQKRQQELQQRTEQTDPQNRQAMEDLARQQQDLKDQMEQLQQALAELEKRMQEFPAEMPLTELEKARESLEQGDMQDQMDKIAQQMRQQQSARAMEGQQQAMQKMGQFLQQLREMQDALRQQQQQQIVNEMRRAMQELLELSQRQEDLKNQSQQMDQASPQFRENAQQQMELLRDLGNVTTRIGEIGKKTFGITPEMGKSLGDAMRKMRESMQSLDQRNAAGASQQQSEAMASLNEAAVQLGTSLNAMMSGGMGGMGMAAFMQRMQSLTGMQQGINEGTQNLGMSQERAAELGRLAGQQGMARKSLEQLTREATYQGELSKMLGDLNSIAREMREVQTDLAQGNVNPETLRKQERILSRLLDSQRSARERDFERRRRAETGTDITRRGPGPIDLTTQEGRNRLRQDLLKAMEEGYARDYEELIRRYFEALEREERQQ